MQFRYPDLGGAEQHGKNVARSRMWAKGYGRDRIVRDCPELECKVQNRRVISNLRTEKDT